MMYMPILNGVLVVFFFFTPSLSLSRLRTVVVSDGTALDPPLREVLFFC